MSLQIRSPANQIKTLQYEHHAKVESKVPIIIGSRVLIPLHDAALNTLAAYVYEAEISGAPKASGAVTINAPLYWDDTAKNVTTVAGSAPANTKIGYALEAMGAADTTTGLIAYNAYA